MTPLRVESLSKSYRGQPVLCDVTLSVEAGEFCVLLGPSGSGKSTLLQIVAGLEKPDSGSVWIGDRDVTQFDPAIRDIAMVFQSYALYPTMSVRDNIGFSLRVRGHRRAEISAAVNATADLLKIRDVLDRRPAALSGGQQQRVAIGRALIRRSSIFALDEPLSSLDSALRTELRGELRRLHAQSPRTTLYVTHDQSEAMTLADRIAVLDGGRILQFDDPNTVYAKPASKRVASLIGNPAMNFVEGRLASHEGKAVLQSVGGNWPLPALSRNLGGVDDRPAVLGFRPEHGLLLPNAGRDGISAQVVNVENTGPDRYIIAAIPSSEVSIRVGVDISVQQHAKIKLSINPRFASVFCSSTGARLN